MISVLRINRGPVAGARICHGSRETGLQRQLLESLFFHPHLKVPAGSSACDRLHRTDQVVAAEKAREQLIEQQLIRLLAFHGIFLTEILVGIDEQNFTKPISIDGSIRNGLDRAGLSQHRRYRRQIHKHHTIHLGILPTSPSTRHLARGVEIVGVGVGDDERGVTRITREERIRRRAKPLHRCVQWREELRTGLALDRDRNTPIREFDHHQRQRSTTRCPHLGLVADRNQVTLGAISTQRAR